MLEVDNYFPTFSCPLSLALPYSVTITTTTWYSWICWYLLLLQHFLILNHKWLKTYCKLYCSLTAVVCSFTSIGMNTRLECNSSCQRYSFILSEAATSSLNAILAITIIITTKQLPPPMPETDDYDADVQIWGSYTTICNKLAHSARKHWMIDTSYSNRYFHLRNQRYVK